MFENSFSFDGRIRRKEYVFSTFGAVLLACIPILGTIPALWLFWAQGAKRSHDIGNSGWWQLIPLYGFWLVFKDGEAGRNQYGKNPKGIEQNNHYPPINTKPQNGIELGKDSTIDKNKSELQMAKESLISLKNSGIINNEEFDSKVKEIKNQINNYDMLNTNEYKQLKYLFDSNILTKQEFEEKIKILENKGLSSLNLENEISVGEDNTIINGEKRIKFEIKYVSSNHSFKFGNFKCWTLQFENSEIFNFYTKNSDNTYFISVNGDVKKFKNKEGFIIYSFNQVKN